MKIIECSQCSLALVKLTPILNAKFTIKQPISLLCESCLAIKENCTYQHIDPFDHNDDFRPYP